MVKQNLFDKFFKRYSKLATKNYENNETVVKHFDNTWSLDSKDMVDYWIKNSRGYRFFLVVIETFSRNAFGVPFKKAAQTENESFLLPSILNLIWN